MGVSGPPAPGSPAPTRRSSAPSSSASSGWWPQAKTRLLLTVLGVTLAVVTFVTLRTALRSWDIAQEVARQDRLVTRTR